MTGSNSAGSDSEHAPASAADNAPGSDREHVADGTPGRGHDKPATRRGVKLAFGTLAALLGTALAVTAVEVLIRTFDPIGLNYDVEFGRYRTEALHYFWEQTPPDRITEAELDGALFWHKANLDLDLGSFSLRTNTLGFRGPEISVEKPPGTLRIVVLGDSVAFGWGVDEEVSFVRRFEQELAAKVDRRVEVVNTGNLVYDSMQQLALLEQRAMRLQPDLVLLVYVTNDIDPTRDLIQEQFLPSEHPLHRTPDPTEQIQVPDDLWSWLGRGCNGIGLSAIAKLLYLASPDDQRALAALPLGTRYVPEQFGKGPRGWRRSRQALLRMQELCRAEGVPFVVLDHTRPAVDALPIFCREHGIDHHLLRFSDEELEQPIYNSMLDTHANALGNQMLLDKLMALLPELPLDR
jgi:lysophospholipase L1-like esterase